MNNRHKTLLYGASNFGLQVLLYIIAAWFSNNVMLVSYVLIVICFGLSFGLYVFTSNRRKQIFLFSFFFFSLNFLVATWLVYVELAIVVGQGRLVP
jgi:hypothetical protein